MKKCSSSSEEYLEILVRNDWRSKADIHVDDRRLSLLSDQRSRPNIKAYLLENDTAFLTTAQSPRSSVLEDPAELSQSGSINEVLFKFGSKELSQDEETRPSYRLIDEGRPDSIRFAYSQELCLQLARQNIYRETCGCFDQTLAMEEHARQDLKVCQSVPSVFRRATQLFVDGGKAVVQLLDESKNVIGEYPFNASVFARGSCMATRIIRPESDICPLPRLLVMASLKGITPLPLTTEYMESMCNANQRMSLAGLVPKNISGLRLRPSAWRIFISKKEEVYPIPKLMSDFGGMFGLWLGASVVSILDQLCALWQKWRTRKVQDETEEEKKQACSKCTREFDVSNQETRTD